MINSPKKTYPIFIVLIGGLCMFLTNTSYSQAQKMNMDDMHDVKRTLPADTTIKSTHEVTVNGQTVPYQTIVGTIPVYGENGKPDAALFYTYYKRTDVEDYDNRPIIISFNGGPGSGSLWMHLGYTSPKRLKISDEGYPIQPYGVEDNNDSIIDVADIVYVNPVNTGFSRILNDGKREQFFGVTQDIDYLANWIDTFISRNGRWNSPKYLVGESYGTTRVSGLADELQSETWMYLNGVILVSECGLGLEPEGASVRSEVLKLPYYATTAWYHEKLSQELQSKSITEIQSEVEEFTLEEFLPAVSHGGSLDDSRKKRIAQQVARYSGLSEEFVLDYNLTVPTSAFWKELLHDEGFTIGRLDSRYKGIDKTNAGDRPDYQAEQSMWSHAFAPAINHYMRQDLGFKTDLRYNLFGSVHPWDRSDNNVGERLRQAMSENPSLEVYMQGGYYDGACDYFTAKYTLWNIDPAGKLQNRISMDGYQSGHMMYLRSEDRKGANNDLREFIQNSIPEEGEPTKYQ